MTARAAVYQKLCTNKAVAIVQSGITEQHSQRGGRPPKQRRAAVQSDPVSMVAVQREPVGVV